MTQATEGKVETENKTWRLPRPGPLLPGPARDTAGSHWLLRHRPGRRPPGVGAGSVDCTAGQGEGFGAGCCGHGAQLCPF